MTKDKAQRIINKIENLESYFSKMERQNIEVSQGLLEIRMNLYRYFL